MSTKYKDLNLLTLWIENQKSFGKHKKNLDTIYNSVDKRSEEHLGIKNNNKLYASILNHNISLAKQFKENEKKLTQDKENDKLFKKIISIKKRENVAFYLKKRFTNNSIEQNYKMIDYKLFVQKIKNNNLENINKINSFFGNRINTKSSNISFKKWDKDFNRTQYYKNFTRKFHLPDIKKTGKSLAKIDTKVYIRKIQSGKINSVDHLNTNENEIKTEPSVTSLQKKAKNLTPVEINDSNFIKFKSKILKIVHNNQSLNN